MRILRLAVAAHAQDAVKIGWPSSPTGPLSSAAVAEINRAGGILGHPVEMLTRGTAGDPVRAVKLAQQLVFSDKM